MRYFSDFMRDEVYAVNDNGIGTSKSYIQKSLRPFEYEVSEESFFTPDVPWLSEENGIGFLVKEITEKEYNGFGVEWLFSPDGGKESKIQDIIQSLK